MNSACVRLGQVIQVLLGEPTPHSDSNLSVGLFVVCRIIFSVCSELRVKRASEPTVCLSLDRCLVYLQICRGTAIVSYCGRAQACNNNIMYFRVYRTAVTSRLNSFLTGAKTR